MTHRDLPGRNDEFALLGVFAFGIATVAMIARFGAPAEYIGGAIALALIAVMSRKGNSTGSGFDEPPYSESGCPVKPVLPDSGLSEAEEWHHLAGSS